MKYLISALLLGFGSHVFAEEIYLAQLKTINAHVNGTLGGSVTLDKSNDEFLAYSRLFAGAPETWHMQNVYTGRCPDERDDTNLDGFIDIHEAAAVLKNILIPLDGDLNSQMGGFNIFPVADIYGSYFYEKEAKYSSLLKDLKNPDPEPTDNIIKLGRNEKLVLEGKVVLFQGVSKDIIFPETVGSYGEVPQHKTLPIACGVFKKIRDN